MANRAGLRVQRGPLGGLSRATVKVKTVCATPASGGGALQLLVGRLPGFVVSYCQGMAASLAPRLGLRGGFLGMTLVLCEAMGHFGDTVNTCALVKSSHGPSVAPRLGDCAWGGGRCRVASLAVLELLLPRRIGLLACLRSYGRDHGALTAVGDAHE